MGARARWGWRGAGRRARDPGKRAGNRAGRRAKDPGKRAGNRAGRRVEHVIYWMGVGARGWVEKCIVCYMVLVS